MSANQRLKLFYATQPRSEERALGTPEFVLFVNDPQLLGETYARYLEAQLREAEPFLGLPLMLNFRPRTETGSRQEAAGSARHSRAVRGDSAGTR
jgi:predicted GTPase